MSVCRYVLITVYNILDKMNKAVSKYGGVSKLVYRKNQLSEHGDLGELKNNVNHVDIILSLGR